MFKKIALKPFPLVALMIFMVWTVAFLSGSQSQSGSSEKKDAVQQPSKAQAGTALENSATPENSREIMLESLTNELIKSGWDKGAAQAVIDLNVRWFSLLFTEDKAELKRQLQILSRLGNYPQFAQILKKRPETAGLLAAASDPKLIEQSLRASSEADYSALANVYLLHAAPDEAKLLSEALLWNKELIIRLNKLGYLGSETLFIFPRTSEGAREYELWVSEVFKSGLSDPEALSQSITFLLSQGRTIRDKLNSDPEFLRRFRSEYWPKLNHIITSKGESLDEYVWDSRLWDLLKLPEGEALLKKWGLLSLDLLMEGRSRPDNHVAPPYPLPLRDRVVQLLLKREDVTILGLVQLRDRPLFRDLLARPLPDTILASAINELLDPKSNIDNLLNNYAKIRDAGLYKTFGPPPHGVITWVPFYQAYVVAEKIKDGRDPTTGDLAFAALDIGCFFVGGSALGVLEKQAAQNVLKISVQKSVANNFSRYITKEAIRRLGTTGTSQIQRTTIPQALSKAYSTMRNSIAEFLAERASFEITAPTRFFFENSKVGRETFKRMTGLEARVFMRGDARVVIRPLGTIPKPIARFLDLTAQNMEFSQALESKTGRKTFQVIKKGADKAKEEAGYWKEHISAWWLQNASGFPN